MNVKALYTNIPHKEGIAAVQTILNRNNVNTTLTQWILRSIECILTNNNFTFNDQYYIQLQGTAMGTKMAPKYANIFMHVFEEQLLTNAPLKPIAFFRFIDDIMLVWSHGIKALNEFIEAANNLYPTIKFAQCISPEKVNFLDTTVHLVDNSLETEIYTKPTDTHQYLLPSSCHSRHIIKNIPRSLALRIRRVCSTSAFFDKHAAQLTTYLILRQYKEKRVRRVINEVKAIPRETLLGPSSQNSTNRIPFVTNYCPQLPRFNSIFRKYECILKSDEHLNKVFPEKPVVAYRRTPTLRDILVKSNLKPILPEPSKPHGFYHCHRHNCTTCSHSIESTTFYAHHTGTNHNVQGYITCNTSNVIYIITCTKCNKQYIGETGRKLKTRISEHLRNIAKNQNTVIGTHFNSANHKSNHMQINAIESLSNSTGYRKVKELFWIKKTANSTIWPKQKRSHLTLLFR